MMSDDEREYRKRKLRELIETFLAAAALFLLAAIMLGCFGR